jgi:hypothetical protein
MQITRRIKILPSNSNNVIDILSHSGNSYEKSLYPEVNDSNS